MVALTFAIGRVQAAVDDGQIGVEQGIAHALQHFKTTIKTQLRKVVKKDTANAALLMAVLVAEIVVTPSFKAWVQAVTKRL